MIFTSSPAQQWSGPPGHVARSSQLQSSPSSGFEHIAIPKQRWHTPSRRRATLLCVNELPHLPRVSHSPPILAPCFNFTKSSHWNPLRWPPNRFPEPPASRASTAIKGIPASFSPHFHCFWHSFLSLPIWVRCQWALKSSPPPFYDHYPNMPPADSLHCRWALPAVLSLLKSSQQELAPRSVHHRTLASSSVCHGHLVHGGTWTKTPRMVHIHNELDPQSF
jgi:hypothetical protein